MAINFDNICFTGSIPVTNEWFLENDKGYLYMHKDGKFYNINKYLGISYPVKKEIEKSVTQKIKLTPDEKNDLYNFKKNHKGQTIKMEQNKLTKENEVFVIKEVKIKELVDENEPRDFLDWNLPKPPLKLLIDACGIGGYIYRKLKSEVEVWVIYNNKTKEYSLRVPTQEVSSASCTFNYNTPGDLEIGVEEVVIDIHSHHSMGISYSGVDDHDDLARMSYTPHISLVIKNITSFDFSNLDKNVDARLSYQGQAYDLCLSDIFDMEDYSLPQVTTKKYEATTIPFKESLSTCNYNNTYDLYNNWFGKSAKSSTPKIKTRNEKENLFDFLDRDFNDDYDDTGSILETIPDEEAIDVMDEKTIEGIVDSMTDSEYFKFSNIYKCDLKKFWKDYISKK